MSRRISQPQRPRVITSDNPYKGTTYNPALPTLHNYNHKNGLLVRDNRLATNLYRNGTDISVPSESCHSEDTFTETHSYYDCYHRDHGYQTSTRKDSHNSDYTYSDESDATRLPCYEYEDVHQNRQSRNTNSDRSSNKKTHQPSFNRGHQIIGQKDGRKVFPNQDKVCEIPYQDARQRCLNDVNMIPASLPRRVPGSRISDRPQSSQGSSVNSAVIHGCGGRCQTFENVCYYFLQVAFTMGILIGTSLSIAGAVLRKSAARNLQVLVYIGAMLSLVSALLLSVQCTAKHNAKKRNNSLKNANRGPIVLEPLPARSFPYQQQQPLMEEPQRGLPITIIPMSVPVHQVQRSIDPPPIIEQPGVPWWRRKDLMPPR